MNGGLPEMLRSLNAVDSGNSEMSVFERQRSRLSDYFNGNGVFPGLNGDQGLGEMLSGQTIKPDPGLENGWSGDYRRVLNYGNESEIEMGNGIPRTLSCPQNVAEETAVGKGKEAALSPTAAGKESSKKRKADKTQNLEAIPEEKYEEKKKRANGEEDSKMTEQNSSTTTASTNTNNNKNTKGPSANNKKDNSKASEVPKPDYIHVRARRGQATDSHSLAERVRREKISERMKYLQDLVPGCNKITGKAGMLDEIINYVQSLQRQVEFLSMKLAAVNPRLDFDIDNYLVKEVFSNIPTIGTSSDMVNNHAHLQFNALGQGILGSNNVEMVGNNPMDATLRRTTSAPVSIPQPFIDNQLTWEDELQNLYSMEYQQGRSTSFISQPYTGFVESGNVKMEM